MSETSLAMMPWFPRDFITSTLGWRLLERALYRCLLDAQWELEALPTDEAELARIAGATDAEFQEAWVKVKHKFEQGDDGKLRNLKLEEHRTVALEAREKKRAAGRAGGQASVRARTKHRLSSRSTVVEAERQAKLNPPSPSPSPSPIEEHTQTRARDPAAIADEAEHHVGFERIRKAYPPFAGRQNWVIAEHHCRTRLAHGSTWLELLDAVKRYTRFVEGGGVSSTAHVLRPETFFSAADEPWKQTWELPVATARVPIPKAKFVPPPDEPEIASAH